MVITANIKQVPVIAFHTNGMELGNSSFHLKSTKMGK